MRADVLAYSSIGGRNRNEDCALAKHAHGCTIAVLCDGLGGYSQSDEASRLAAQSVLDSLARGVFSRETLDKALYEANERLFEQRNAGLMRSTVAVVWVKDDVALVATVGDTRVYLFRDYEIVFQSIDHSLAQLDVVVGEITSKEIRGSARRSGLLRSLGADDSVKPDVVSLALRPGDVFLLCSDGCWEFVEEFEFEESLGRMSFETWFAWIERVVTARSDANADNNTAIAMRVSLCDPAVEVGA